MLGLQMEMGLSQKVKPRTSQPHSREALQRPRVSVRLALSDSLNESVGDGTFMHITF